MNETEETQARWHVDKSVNLALVLTLLGAIGSGTWFAATANARIGELERRADSIAPQADRITRLEAKIDLMTSTLSEIKALINRAPR